MPLPDDVYTKSKQSSANAQAVVPKSGLYSQPVVDELDLPSKPKIVTSSPPFYNENSTAVNQFIDSMDFEGSTTNEVSKLFDFNKGFKGLEPLILFTSDFSSLYEKGKKNDVSEAIKLLHHSRILNTKTALEVFLNLDKFKESVVDVIKNDLDNFVKSQSTTLHDISRLKNDAVYMLDVSSYKDQVKKNDNTTKTISFLEFLNSNGYVNASKQFSNTKIWQQSLIELKKALLSHSSKLLGVQPLNIDDNDPWVLHGVTPENSFNKQTRIWFNPYVSMPTASEFTLPDDSSNIKKMNSFVSLIADLDKAQFLDLSINADSLIKTSSDPSNKGAKQLATGNLSEFAKSVQSNQFLENYSSSGRDISIIANLIFKELAYSSSLITKTDELELNDYGYSLSTTGDNFKVWDHLIGRFYPDVRNVAKSPTGNGNSLVSLSQRLENDYQVLTFEKNRIYQENKNFTGGNLFYVESSLNALETGEGDFSRLDELILFTKRSANTLDKIYKIMGYNPGNQDYTKQNSFASVYTLDGLINKLSVVSKVYKRCLAQDDGKDDRNIAYNASLDTTKLKNLSDYDSVGIRLAAVICKTALKVRNQNASSFSISGLEYQNIKDLKFLLFMLMMNVVLSRVENTPEAAKSINIIKDKISSMLSVKTLSGGVNDISTEVVDRASSAARTYPFYKNLHSGYEHNQNSVNQSGIPVHDRIFQIDIDQGIWKIMSDVLVDIYNSQIYTSSATGTFTSYSGISKTAYMYAYFDLMMRIISAQTFEDIEAIYDVEYVTNPGFTGTSPIDGTTYTVPPSKEREKGLMLTSTKRANIAQYYLPNFLPITNNVFAAVAAAVSNSFDTDPNVAIYNKKLKNAVKNMTDEEVFLFDSVKMFLNYLKTLNYKLVNFRNSVDKILRDYTNNVFEFFTQESLQLDDATQRAALFNLTLSEEQILMNRYILDEYKDRLKSNSDAEAKLKNNNVEFTTFSEGFSDFLNVNDTEIISYDFLSSYFNSIEFEKAKSINKKIISVALPPKLVSSLRDSNSANDPVDKLLQNVIRIRVYKIDRLSPTIIYKPQEHLFEMNRFPTRMLSNWSLDVLNPENFDIFKLPMKLFNFKNNNFIVCKNFLDAFPDDIYNVAGNSILNQSDKLSIYSNHVKSFLIEEYLRWLTEAKFEESRYHRYTGLTEELSLVKDQYGAYLTYLGRTATNNRAQSAATTNAPVTATFIDPVSKKEYKIPMNTVSSLNNSTNVNSSNRSNKTFNLNLDSTMNAFFQNETLLSDVSSELKKRAILPKKFDRVFNILLDPDDFEVDSCSPQIDLTKAVSMNVLQKTSTGVYKHRDTSSSDVTFDEYFVTVEPYDYALEYSQP